MKVLMLTDTLRNGGAEKSFSILFNGLVSEKIDVTPCVLEHFTKPVMPLNAQEVKFFRCKYTKSRILKLIRIVSDAFKLCNLQQKFPHDVFLSFQNRSNITLVLAKALSKFYKNKIICTLISVRNYKKYRKKSLLYRLNRTAYRFSDSITVNAQEIKDNLVDYYEITPSKIHVIPNGYDKDHIKDKSFEDVLSVHEKSIYENGKKTLVNVARLAKQKNQSFLIDMVSKLPEKYQLVFVGGGEYESSLRKKITKMRLTGRVFLLGEKSNPLPYVRQADVFVYSSLHEGYPNVLVEALILNKPIVSTYFKSGLKELLIDTNAGTVIPSCDVSAFASAVIGVENLSSNSRIYSIDHLVTLYMRILYNM